MKAKIDLDKFVHSLMKRYYEKIHIDPTTTKCWLDSVLEDQGLEYKDGKIVEILQESEDEKIIKALLEYFAEECDTSTISGIYCYKIYDWLKKQSEKKSIGNIKPKFNAGDWVVYNRNDSSIEILYIYDIRDGKYYFNDNIHFSWSVKECDERCHLWTINDAKDGDILLSKYNQPFIYNGIFDEESVGAYCGIDKLGNDFLKGIFSCDWSYKEGVKPATKEQRDFLFSKIKEAGYEFNFEKKELKMITQKTIVNDESKFHEGDWIIYKNDICQIVKREEGRNKLVTVFGIEKELVNERNLSTAQFWTIQDAKDGDVLISEDDCPFIYAGNHIYTKYLTAYCGITNNGEFKISDKTELWTNDNVKPAIKDQRDFLFLKMKEKGYKWDSIKKEVKKIKKYVSKQKWSEEDDAYKLFTISAVEDYYDEKNPLQKNLVDWLKSLKDRVQPQLQPAWSEDDEKMVNDIIAAIDTLYYHEMVNWLKSIKNRMQSQSDWSEEDKVKINRIVAYLENFNVSDNDILLKDIDWLKSLRPRNQWKPSNEQIIALRWVLNNIPYNKHKEEISGLLDQIKNL